MAARIAATLGALLAVAACAVPQRLNRQKELMAGTNWPTLRSSSSPIPMLSGGPGTSTAVVVADPAARTSTTSGSSQRSSTTSLPTSTSIRACATRPMARSPRLAAVRHAGAVAVRRRPLAICEARATAKCRQLAECCVQTQSVAQLCYSCCAAVGNL